MLRGGVSAESSALNLDAAATSDYERKVTAFNQKRSWPKGYVQSRVSSWADPVSARGILIGDDSEGESDKKNAGTDVIREEGDGEEDGFSQRRVCAKRWVCVLFLK
jgi:hypothetical protein